MPRFRRLGLSALAIAILGFLSANGAQASRWGKSYFPNASVVTHDGKTLQFYDDLIKDKVFVISFLFTTCRDICPLATARLAELQEKLGDSMGRDIFFYSITIDPETDTPERLFERRWALTLLESTLSLLRDEYDRSGKGALFAALQPHLHGDADRMPLAKLAASLGMSPEALKVAAHRLRRRYRDLLRQQITETVDSPEEVDDELRRLMEALSG